MRLWRWLKREFRWWRDEQDKLCPHCGYNCHGRSVYCTPPIVRAEAQKGTDHD